MRQTTERKKIVLALIEKEGQFLLIKRKRPHLHIVWAFPGGIIKPQETEEEAVVREIKEEVKLDIDIVTKKTEWQHPNTLVSTAYFHCKLKPDIPNQKPEIGEEYEIEKIEWVEAGKIFEYFDPKAEVHPIIREFILSFTAQKKEPNLELKRGRH